MRPRLAARPETRPQGRVLVFPRALSHSSRPDVAPGFYPPVKNARPGDRSGHLTLRRCKELAGVTYHALVMPITAVVCLFQPPGMHKAKGSTLNSHGPTAFTFEKAYMR